MTPTSLIVARWIAERGHPRIDRDDPPTVDQIIAFCFEHFQQVPSYTVACNVRIALRGVAS
jgi:hypothetical protein